MTNLKHEKTLHTQFLTNSQFVQSGMDIPMCEIIQVHWLPLVDLGMKQGTVSVCIKIQSVCKNVAQILPCYELNIGGAKIKCSYLI